jgi:DNA-directed RNA polymerase specialized sigma subunit
LLLTLRFEDELSAAEIADILGMPSQFHVYRRLKVILAGLKNNSETGKKRH